MRDELQQAKSLLEKESYTCVLCRDGQVICHRERGVAPLLAHVRAGEKMNGFVAADRVVGRAAAFLYVLLGVEEVYAGVLSRPALAVLRRYGIVAEYGTLTDVIQNRAGDGFCPMEQAVLTAKEPQEALLAIERRLVELNQKKK
ncbi:MAG: DUF1893 domain-containing protein [Ruminococcaceae bacterium]|nr:DUF1893 domain-containing protein [Oscillospiraceae bacterium]